MRNQENNLYSLNNILYVIIRIYQFANNVSLVACITDVVVQTLNFTSALSKTRPKMDLLQLDY